MRLQTTATPSNTPSNSATQTPSNTNCPTPTPTSTQILTSTPTITPSITPTITPTNTSTTTVTPTNTITPTNTTTPSNTVTTTPTNTSTPTPTQTNTPTSTSSDPCEVMNLFISFNDATYSGLYYLQDAGIGQPRYVSNSPAHTTVCACLGGNCYSMWYSPVKNALLFYNQSTSGWYLTTANVSLNACSAFTSTLIGQIAPVVGLRLYNGLLIPDTQSTGSFSISYINCPTPTPTSTTTPTRTPTSTTTSTPTNTPTNTSTSTNTPTNTTSITPTQTQTNTATTTVTPTNTQTNTPSNTPTNTSTNTPTNTPTASITPSLTPTETPTNTPTITATNTETPTNTPTNTVTMTPSSTPPCFESGSGFSAQTNTSALLVSGNTIMVGGSFTSYNGVSPNNRIIRLFDTGVIDSSFNSSTGFNNPVTEIEKQTTGQYIVTGTFTGYTGSSVGGIMRLNPDGSRDTSWAFNASNPGIIDVKIANDDGILVAGAFTTISGVSRNRFVKLTSGGTIDSTFNIGSGFNSTTNSIAVQNDGKILVGGLFTQYSGASWNKLIRLNIDGSIDNTFNIGTGFAPTITASTTHITIQTDGKILVSGNYNQFSGITVPPLVRLNSDGSLDSSFNYTGGLTATSDTLQTSDGKIILIGGGVNNIIQRLNSDGSIDTSFNIGTGFFNSGINWVVREIRELSSNRFVIVGVFNSYNGYEANAIVVVNNDGSINDCTLNPAPTPTPTVTPTRTVTPSVTPTNTPTQTNTPTPSSTPPSVEFLLQEDGSFILQEDGGQIIIE